MKENSKYFPLYVYLKDKRPDEVTLDFDAIESLLGVSLPPSARRQRIWWSNREKGALQARAWIDAGYETKLVDLAGEKVTFRHRSPQYSVTYEEGLPVWRPELIRALREHMRLTQAEMSEELGMRQQTISEWETGAYAPSRANAKYLTLIAERAGFFYDQSSSEATTGPDTT